VCLQHTESKKVITDWEEETQRLGRALALMKLDFSAMTGPKWAHRFIISVGRIAQGAQAAIITNGAAPIEEWTHLSKGLRIQPLAHRPAPKHNWDQSGGREPTTSFRQFRNHPRPHGGIAPGGQAREAGQTDVRSDPPKSLPEEMGPLPQARGEGAAQPWLGRSADG
jgi:hypothetical protein